MALDITAARAKASRTAKSFSPQQLLILGGLAVVSIMGLVALMRWVSQPTYSALAAGASTSEVAKITDALNGAGITYKLAGNGSGVMVSQADLAQARIAVSAAGVSTTGTAAGYDILDNQGLTTSDFKQQIDYKRALEGELTNTLMEMNGVDTARVTLSIPEKALFKDDQDTPRASILVGANSALDASGVRAIMQTVAAAVPGLSSDNVTVTDTTGQILSVAGLSMGDDPMAMARKYEAATAAQAQSMLDTIFGSGRSVVRVSADMDLDQTESKETRYDTANTVLLASQSSEERMTGIDGGGATGIAGVTGSTLPNGATADPTGEYTKIDAMNNVGAGTTETVTRATPGKVQKLSVAVAIDQAAMEAAGADPAAIKTLVAAAVGADTTAAPDGRADVIEVQPQAFDTEGVTAAEEATKAMESAKSKDKMIGYARTGGALLVLLLAVLFLRKGLKSRGDDEIDEIDELTLARSAEPFGVLAAGGGSNAAGGATGARSTALATMTDSERDRAAGDRRALDPATEVLDLIDREPEDVAALLRSWVADRRS